MAIKNYPETPDNSQTIPSSSPRISPRQLLTGTASGHQVLRIKGAIIVNDGTNDRVLIGDFDI